MHCQQNIKKITDHVLHPYRTRDKIIVSYILIFMFLDMKLEAKDSGSNLNTNSLSSVCTYFLHEDTW